MKYTLKQRQKEGRRIKRELGLVLEAHAGLFGRPVSALSMLPYEDITPNSSPGSRISEHQINQHL